jgi:drug/metabolite transporter (DMT)-like permease
MYKLGFVELAVPRNTICVAAISMAFLGEQLSRLVLLGSTVVLSGAALVELGKDSNGDPACLGTGTAESGKPLVNIPKNWKITISNR